MHLSCNTHLNIPVHTQVIRAHYLTFLSGFEYNFSAKSLAAHSTVSLFLPTILLALS